MTSKICPYNQNQQSLEEQYTYTEEGLVKTFKQKMIKGNAICIREDCAVWDTEKNRCNYYCT